MKGRQTRCKLTDTLFPYTALFRSLLGAGFLEHRAARDDDVAALAVHLQDLERLRHVHQRGHVAHRADIDLAAGQEGDRSEEHTSELQSLMRISYAVFCLTKKNTSI